MTWVCEMCSTSNTDKNKTCFVCDSPRGSLDIKTTRIAARYKRVKSAESDKSKIANRLPLLLAYVVGVAIAVIVILSLVNIIINYQTGNVDATLSNISDISRSIGNNISETIGGNIERITSHIFSKDDFMISEKISILAENRYEAMRNMREQTVWIFRDLFLN